MDNPALKSIPKSTRTADLPPPTDAPRPVGRSKSPAKTTENAPVKNEGDGFAKLIEQYGCGPIQFAGSSNASYERHLIFDNAIALDAAGTREKFEAFARSVRDVLSQRWVRTEETYVRKNPKRIYYLSMEYLIGRSLSNNKTNGVTPRRWLLLANPQLARTITDAIGNRWIFNLAELRKLKPLASDSNFQESFLNSKREAKVRFADWLKATTGQVVKPEM